MRDYDQSYLELSLEYANAGLYDEAIDVLSNTGLAFNNQSVNPPLVSYYLANFWAKKGNDAKANEYYAAAAKASPDYCFPFRLEEIDILESAMKANPSDPKAPYYLGNLLFDFQPEKAIELWEISEEGR